MSTLSGGPNIVTDGLVLHLDAANVKSYVSGSTTWTDLSRGSNNGTLTNGPTYSTANGGSIVFDGVNDFVVVSNFPQLPVSSSARTVNIWFKPNVSTWQNNVNNMFFYGTAGTNGATFGIDFSTYPVMEVYTWGGTGRDIFFSSSFSQTGWSNITITYNGSTTLSIYENGTNTQNTTITQCNTGNTDIWVGAIRPTYQPWYYEGNIAQVQIYNRALSAQEVLQNYNTTKTRFGL
jgi:hypothetical protein